jgi:hypothetical protein
MPMMDWYIARRNKRRNNYWLTSSNALKRVDLNSIREKALENAKQRYVQRSQRSLVEYLNCWRTWIYAGLPFKVGRVDDVVKSIVGAVINGTSFNRTKEQSCVGTIKNQKSDFESPTRINHSIIRSVDDGYNNQMK